jgi:hypothetical protein
MNLKVTRGGVWIVSGALALVGVIHEERAEHIEQREYQEPLQTSYEISNSTLSVSTLNMFTPEMLTWFPPKK